MSEKLEQVKAAIAEKFAPAIDFRSPYANVMLKMAATAAIEAMREPTEAMIEKGIWSRSKDGRYGPVEIATTIYGAMIDEALK